MREETEAIRTYYNADPLKEWNRLIKKHPYEKYITTHMMDRYIHPGSALLDIGGGPGHYSIHYAKQGHTVTLLDLSEENVRFAKRKARQYGVKITALQGNALDLSRFPDESFDAVFLMGPLYHLMNEESRLQALQEAARVLKQGGHLFSSFILMFGGVIYGLRELEETILRDHGPMAARYEEVIRAIRGVIREEDEDGGDRHMDRARASRLDGLAYDEKTDGDGAMYADLFDSPIKGIGSGGELRDPPA